MEGRAAQLSGAGGGLVVRPAVAADGHLLGAIERAAGERFRSVGMAEVADAEPPTVGQYLSAIAHGLVWVAELDGELVGYVHVLDLGGQPHLEQISVLPTAGGQGVGVALIEPVLAWAGRVGGRSVTLSTFRDLPWNAPWYERLGWVELGEADLDDRLRAIRAHEVELGLDVSARVFMRRPLD